MDNAGMTAREIEKILGRIHDRHTLSRRLEDGLCSIIRLTIINILLHMKSEPLSVLNVLLELVVSVLKQTLIANVYGERKNGMQNLREYEGIYP